MSSADKQVRSEQIAEAGPTDSAAEPTTRDERLQGGKRPKEIGGPAGPEPTRYGDWERAGRCVDF